MQTGDIFTMIVISTLVMLLLVSVVVITIVLSNRRHVQQEVKYERELRTAEQEVREHVLAHVGRELHDNIGQLLTTMHFLLEQHRIMNPSAAPVAAELKDTLAEVKKEVSLLSRSLNSDLFENNGLANTIQNEVSRLQRLGKFSVNWEYDSEPQLSKDQKIIAFRIFQEIINNALKHSNAGRISIVMSGGAGFRLVVSDDGKGFDVDMMMRSTSGAGLKNMVKRAEMAKLKCDIKATVGKGATFALEAA